MVPTVADHVVVVVQTVASNAEADVGVGAGPCGWRLLCRGAEKFATHEQVAVSMPSEARALLHLRGTHVSEAGASRRLISSTSFVRCSRRISALTFTW